MPQSLRILLIKDCEAHARIVELVLRKVPDANFNLSRVERLSSALKLLQEKSFDVALLDLGLPDSDGLSAVTTLKEAAPDLPIFVMTASDDEQLAEDAIQLGAERFLSKESVMTGEFVDALLGMTTVAS